MVSTCMLGGSLILEWLAEHLWGEGGVVVSTCMLGGSLIEWLAEHLWA